MEMDDWKYNRTTVFAPNGLRYKSPRGPGAACVNAEVRFDELRTQTNERIATCANAMLGVASPHAFMAKVREVCEKLPKMYADIGPINDLAKMLPKALP